jgi:DNA repair protein RadC
MSLVLNYGAYSVILAHNHPSGMAIPSQADYRATVRIQEVLGQVGVGLYDHYIVADHEVVSMRDSGLLD